LKDESHDPGHAQFVPVVLDVPPDIKQETLPQKPWFCRGTAAQRKVPSMVFGEFMSGENFNDTGARLVFGWGPGNSNGPWWPWVKDVKVKLYTEASGFQVSLDVHRNMICWLVVWNMNGLFSIYWECHHPN